MRRRKFLEKMASTGLGLVYFTRINSNAYLPPSDIEKKYSDRAFRLVTEATAMIRSNSYWAKILSVY